mmetsp:Transcript_52903/g.60060  ORF Transcript_52903/g.60060 Transcript_52903/m.60060 type:complete len:155 (+) Transcript_52903:251-715(+)
MIAIILHRQNHQHHHQQQRYWKKHQDFRRVDDGKFQKEQEHCLRHNNHAAIVRQEGEDREATRVQKETSNCEQEQKATRCTRHSKQKIRTLDDSIIQRSKYMLPLGKAKESSHRRRSRKKGDGRRSTLDCDNLAASSHHARSIPLNFFLLSIVL